MQNASLAFGLFKTKLDDKAYPSLVTRFYEITMPSAGWDHFNGGKDDTVCHHCGKVVKNKGGNTSNLMAHIKTKQFYKVKKYRYYRYFLYIVIGFQYRNSLKRSQLVLLPFPLPTSV